MSVYLNPVNQEMLLVGRTLHETNWEAQFVGDEIHSENLAPFPPFEQISAQLKHGEDLFAVFVAPSGDYAMAPIMDTPQEYQRWIEQATGEGAVIISDLCTMPPNDKYC